MSAEHETYSKRIKHLKNGSEYPHALLMAAIHAVNKFSKSYPKEFFELVKLCRFPRHTVAEQCLELFSNFEFIRGSEVKDIIRDIILSSVTGRTMNDLEIKSPLQNGAEPNLLC